MDSTVTNSTVESGIERGSAKHGPKLYGGIASLVLVVVTAVVVAPKLSDEAPVSAAATTVVTVAQPLQLDLHGRLQFLGQFSPVDQVELRAQVGGTLTYIGFKDGDVVRKGALLFTIDPTPYQIKFDEGAARVATARARLELAKTELARAQTLQKTDAGTLENVEQRSAEQRSAQAALDEAEAQVRDAKFDLDRTNVYAPLSGRMGTHLVSVGNLVSGNRGGGSSTTLLATIVSIDPIYLNFDMSEGDYLNFQRDRASRKSELVNKVDIALSDEHQFVRQGTLNFLDNSLDRASGTIHARATVPNSDLLLTPGEFGRVRVGPSGFTPSASCSGCRCIGGSDGSHGSGCWSGWCPHGKEGGDRWSSLRLARHLFRTCSLGRSCNRRTTGNAGEKGIGQGGHDHRGFR